MHAKRTINVVGVHAAGEVGDVIVGGVLDVPGKTMFDKMMYFWKNADDIRQIMLNEPRGRPSKNANLILPPCDPRADAGFIIMESEEYPPMSGSNTICTTTVLLETGMVKMQEPITTLNLDTAAGLVTVSAECESGKCKTVAFDNVPAFVFHLDLKVEVPGIGKVLCDIVWGGMMYAILDISQVGLTIDSSDGERIVEYGERVKRAVQRTVHPIHPENPGINGVTNLVFTEPLQSETSGKSARNATVVSPGRLDRSPCGTGTCARMAQLYARDELLVGESFRHISPIGTEFMGTIRGTTKVGEYNAILPTVKGSAWITSYQQVVLDPSDPFPEGFRIQQQGFTLDEAMTECLLTRSQDLLRSEPIEVMLGAALHAFVRVFPDRGLPAMFNESHGRDALGDRCDISQTVGWFTTMAPVASSVGSSVLDTVRRVKDARHQLLRGGWPYFASRYLTPEGQASFGGHFPMEIILNYLGRYHIFEQVDGLFARLPAPDLPCLYPDLKRFSLFEILVTVDIGQLEVKFSYPRDIKHQSRIEEWIQQYRILLEEAFTGTEPLLSLNDFPLLSMGYKDLDRLAKEILPTIRGPATLTNLEELYPCTPIQSGLLVSQARNPAYYEYATIAEVYPPAAGQLVDAKRLARAWQELVRRHSILRTVFVESISPDRLYDQAVLRDWNGEVMYPQDLPGIEFAPGHSLHRLAICVAENGAVFVRLDMNHAISDGASTSILFRDLALAYHGKLVGSPLSQYRDFVSFLLQDDKQKHLAYWVDRLSGAEPCLLPLSVHSEGPSNEIEFTRVSLPQPASQLRTFCIRNGVTLSTLLQAAWAMVLRIYCDSDRVCFGSLVSGRDVPIDGVENVIGPFLNILVCQLAFDLHFSPDYHHSPTE
ncbi:hypothetical protein ASPFODRAFT_84018 [Aspergillus luchuensis CBS 106.47]|uniref:Condensation domain-containing protein n=1 Tax=Aspergillus luchuensis (strain CBS 106.47) TaxID=1137211 RepID=A0A1M3T756_ASPLC|nr:hypothetical protein ASPFODRAFT_84018 [Aspergillus luchuensis CBS 106.47]